MITNSGNHDNEEFTKLCRNRCGTYIRWDRVLNTYFDTVTNSHRCPNWIPKQVQSLTIFNRKITTEQQLYVDAIGARIAEILSLVQGFYKHTVQETRKNE